MAVQDTRTSGDALGERYINKLLFVCEDFVYEHEEPLSLTWDGGCFEAQFSEDICVTEWTYDTMFCIAWRGGVVAHGTVEGIDYFDSEQSTIVRVNDPSVMNPTEAQEYR